MASSIIPFLFQSEHTVRVVMLGDAPWFVTADVCRILGIAKPRDAAAKLEDDERASTTVDTLGGPQEVSAISESGVYALIFRSRKPFAIEFRKWVTSDVLPSIRKTGAYSIEMPSGLRPFHLWTLEEKRTNAQLIEVYRRTHNLAETQWFMEVVGIPKAPIELSRFGRQLDLWATVIDTPAQ